MEAYLDNSATTPVCPEAIEAINNTLTKCWGNQSSLHFGGIEASEVLELFQWSNECTNEEDLKDAQLHGNRDDGLIKCYKGRLMTCHVTG